MINSKTQREWEKLKPQLEAGRVLRFCSGSLNFGTSEPDSVKVDGIYPFWMVRDLQTAGLIAEVRANVFALGPRSGAQSDLEIIGAICATLNANGFTDSPKLVRRDDFSLLDFAEQPCDIEGVDVEYINQDNGGGLTGDEFRGTAAYLIGEHLFVINYAS